MEENKIDPYQIIGFVLLIAAFFGGLITLFQSLKRIH